MKDKIEKQVKHIYTISGMHCGGCATAVERKLADLPEVTSVKVNLEKQQAEIVSEAPVQLSTMQGALANTSYAIAEPDTGY
ncbi:MAG: heavy metal-associated domain-containing protein [Owenweeksia sp.]|nr:heavy metal-associated domain-containing protein [Owenweeksia sp.]